MRGDNELSDIAMQVNHMAEEIEQLLEKEKQAEETKNELITNIAHDLRTPLTSILGYLDIPGYLCRKIGFMKKNKPYKEQEPMVPNVGEPVVVYTGNENNPNIVTEGRDDIRHAISGEELLDRLCPRIKALFG